MKVTVFTWFRDNGDGSSTSHIFGTEEARTKEMKDYNTTPKMCEDDPHKNGSLGTDTIKLDIVNGKPVLVSGSIYSHNQ